MTPDFIPQESCDELRSAVAELLQAKDVLDFWHDPESPGRNYESVIQADLKLTQAWNRVRGLMS